MRRVFCTAPSSSPPLIQPVAQQQPPAAVPVGVVKTEAGRDRAVRRICRQSSRRSARYEIRARITGFLEEVLFKEGDLIKEGTPIYRMEKGPRGGGHRRGRRPRTKQGGQSPDRDSNCRRAQELLTPEFRDRRRARPGLGPLDRQAQGQVMADEADFGDAGEFDLGYPGHRCTNHGQNRQNKHHQGQCR